MIKRVINLFKKKRDGYIYIPNTKKDWELSHVVYVSKSQGNKITMSVPLQDLERLPK